MDHWLFFHLLILYQLIRDNENDFTGEFIVPLWEIHLLTNYPSTSLLVAEEMREVGGFCSSGSSISFG